MRISVHINDTVLITSLMCSVSGDRRRLDYTRSWDTLRTPY